MKKRGSSRSKKKRGPLKRGGEGGNGKSGNMREESQRKTSLGRARWEETSIGGRGKNALGPEIRRPGGKRGGSHEEGD